MTITTTTPLPLEAGRWTVDPFHSSVGFTIRHLGISKVRGRFTDFDAELVIGSSLDDTTLTATVDLDSIDTGNTDRDAHVRTEEFIDVARRPTLAFRSERVHAEDDGFRVEGLATIGDVTRPLTLSVELGGLETGPDGRVHAGFEAAGEIRRRDFGIAPQVPAAGLGDVIKLELDIQLLAP